MLSLAQPIKLSEERTARLEALKAIERHVRVLSPSFLSDHIVNSGSDDSFLLRDRNVKQVLAVANLHTFIIQQYQAGRDHLAEAVERRAGFVRV